MGLRDWFARRAAPPAPVVETARPRTPTAADISAALDGVEQQVAGGAVPPLVRSRVARVVATVRDTVPRLANLGPGSASAYTVVATATDYLPQALSNYTRLPRGWADSRPLEGGKTALMLLVDQLDLLAATMDQILDAVVRVDADALVAHGRFLQEKFGTLGAPAPMDPPPASPGPRSSLDLP
jgi:hypothetical protein